jgi:hypothetical protein
MVSPFTDDESTTIFQKERSDGDFVHITWPTYPFNHDVVARISNVTMRCIITYMGQRITDHIVTQTLEFRGFSAFNTPVNKIPFFTECG